MMEDYLMDSIIHTFAIGLIVLTVIVVGVAPVVALYLANDIDNDNCDTA
jgi:hypothetical protein